jgi:hypothetical protein
MDAEAEPEKKSQKEREVKEQPEDPPKPKWKRSGVWQQEAERPRTRVAYNPRSGVLTRASTYKGPGTEDFWRARWDNEWKSSDTRLQSYDNMAFRVQELFQERKDLIDFFHGKDELTGQPRTPWDATENGRSDWHLEILATYTERDLLILITDRDRKTGGRALRKIFNTGSPPKFFPSPRFKGWSLDALRGLYLQMWIHFENAEGKSDGTTPPASPTLKRNQSMATFRRELEDHEKKKLDREHYQRRTGTPSPWPWNIQPSYFRGQPQPLILALQDRPFHHDQLRYLTDLGLRSLAYRYGWRLSQETFDILGRDKVMEMLANREGLPTPVFQAYNPTEIHPDDPVLRQQPELAWQDYPQPLGDRDFGFVNHNPSMEEDWVQSRLTPAPPENNVGLPAPWALHEEVQNWGEWIDSLTRRRRAGQPAAMLIPGVDMPDYDDDASFLSAELHTRTHMEVTRWNSLRVDAERAEAKRQQELHDKFEKYYQKRLYKFRRKLTEHLSQEAYARTQGVFEEYLTIEDSDEREDAINFPVDPAMELAVLYEPPQPHGTKRSRNDRSDDDTSDDDTRKVARTADDDHKGTGFSRGLQTVAKAVGVGGVDSRLPGEKHALLRVGGKTVVANFMGPGTNLKTRLQRGDEPVSDIDKISLAHDLRYMLAKTPKQIQEADRLFLAKANTSSDSSYNKGLGLAAIGAKYAAEKLVGVKYPTQAELDANNASDHQLVPRMAALTQQGYGSAGPIHAITRLDDRHGRLTILATPSVSSSAIRYHGTISQMGRGRAPYDGDKPSKDEELAEARLQARWRRRHGEALQKHASVNKVFPDTSSVDTSWARQNITTEGLQPYSKLPRPSGPTLSSETAKEIVTRLKLPLIRDMRILADMMYNHYMSNGSSSLDRASDSIMKVLKAAKTTLDDVYSRFRVLMNDPATYDLKHLAARNRVQAPPSKREEDMILPIPTTRKDEPDKRYSGGTFHTARDLLDRRKYMSVAGGPFGSYQIDLLDMGERGKPYNGQFWYLLTAINVNSRYVYAMPIKKGGTVKKGETKAGTKARRELQDEPVSKGDAPWITKEIIPAMKRIMEQIETDVAANPAQLEHRRIRHVMSDGGSEFQMAFRKWLQDEGITVSVASPETHEEMSRLNSFHRFFRQRVNAQWRKYHENPRQYGGPVRWVNVAVADKFGRQPLRTDVAEGIVVDPNKPLPPLPTETRPDDWDSEYTPEEQKAAQSSGVWKITYWDDWVRDHNETIKLTSLRGAEVVKTKYSARPGTLRSVRVPKAPKDITDDMVRSLIRYDAARRAEVKKRVDQWIEDHNVVTEEDLQAAGKDTQYATRVRVDLNRTKFGAELQQKGTTFLSIWSERHYALLSREGTNTFRISHKHEEDFPDVWPMYRMRIVLNPSSVSQPVNEESKVNRSDKVAYAPSFDVKVIKALEAKEKSLEDLAKDTEDENYATVAATKVYNTRSRQKLVDIEEDEGEEKENVGDEEIYEPQKVKKTSKKKLATRIEPVPAERVSTRSRKAIQRFGFE